MKFERQKRLIVAWFLLLCMLPLSVTKITHRHGRSQTECCSTHSNDCSHEHGHEDACNCLICKFTLAPFLTTESDELIIPFRFIPHEPVYSVSNLSLEAVHSYLLRGPPVA